MDQPIYILSTEKPTAGIPGAQSDGTPIQRFTHPAFKLNTKYSSSKGPIEGDKTRVDNWLSTFADMRKRGVTIPVGKQHGQRANPDLAMGEIVAAEVKTLPDGEWLCITNEIRGQKNIDVAAANRVSLEIDEPGRIDGFNNVYPERIGGVVYTPVPVVAGQPYALSLEGCEPNTYYLAGDADMDMEKHFKAIEKMNGLPAGSVNADNMTEHVKDHMEKCAGTKGVYMSLEDVNAGKAAMLALTTENAELKTRTASPKLDTKYLSLSARASTAAIDSAVKAGTVTKAVGDKLIAKLIGERTADKFTASPIMLSLANDSQDDVSLVEFVVKCLEDNQPIQKGSYSLSHHLMQDQAAGKIKPKGPNPWYPEPVAAAK